jgi:nitrile hydratase accessory protein
VNGVHDLGGTDGLGPVVVEPDEPVFHADWEKAAFAMFSMPFRAGFFGVDQFRFGIEQMHPAIYLLSPYYEHWMHAAEHYGVATGALDPEEIERRTQHYALMSYRTDATELGEARRRVEALVSELPAGGQRAFEQPWELRAFAMAVAAYHSGQYEWSEFQLSLISSIRHWEAAGGAEPWSYYEHWLSALETVLAGNGKLSEAALDERTRAVLDTPRDTGHHAARREPVAVEPARLPPA